MFLFQYFLQFFLPHYHICSYFGMFLYKQMCVPYPPPPLMWSADLWTAPDLKINKCVILLSWILKPFINPVLTWDFL